MGIYHFCRWNGPISGQGSTGLAPSSGQQARDPGASSSVAGMRNAAPGGVTKEKSAFASYLSLKERNEHHKPHPHRLWILPCFLCLSCPLHGARMFCPALSSVLSITDTHLEEGGTPHTCLEDTRSYVVRGKTF